MRYSHTWALVAGLGTLASASNCYYPDGNKANDYNYQPCGNSGFSTCCYFGEGDKCLSNGLCENPGKYDYYRAACANKDWSNCPNVCMDELSDNWLGLIKCGENKYCCPSGGDDCCTNGAKVYMLEVSNSTGINSGDSTESDSSSSTESGSSSSSDTNDSQSSDAGSSGSSSSSAGPIAGGVVGGLFVIGFVAFGLFYFKRRDKKRAVAAAASVEAGGGSGSDGKDSEEMKPVAQPNVAEVEAGPGNVYNETDGKPIVGGVRPLYEDEKSHYTETTKAASQQGVAEVDGGAVVNNTTSSGAFVSSQGQDGSEATHAPSQHVLAEVDGGMVKQDGSFAPVSTSAAPGQFGYETTYYATQQLAEIQAQDLIRPDSGTLVPDSPRPGRDEFETTHGPVQHSASELEGADGRPGVALTTSGAVALGSGQNPFRRANRPAQNVVSEVEGGYTTGLGAIVQDWTTSGQNPTGTTHRPTQQNVISEIGSEAGMTPASGSARPHGSSALDQTSTRPVQQSVAKMEGGRILTLDSDTFAPVFAFEENNTSTASGQQGVAEVDGGMAKPGIDIPMNATSGQPESQTVTTQQGVAEVEGGAVKMSSSSASPSLSQSLSNTTSTQHIAEVDGGRVPVPTNSGHTITETTKKPAQQTISEVAGSTVTNSETDTSYTRGRTRHRTAQQVVAEADSGNTFYEADSGPIIPVSVVSRPHQPDTRDFTQWEEVTEVGSSPLLEADSFPIPPVFTSHKHSTSRTTRSSSEQVVAEADSNAIIEADSTPLSSSTTRRTETTHGSSSRQHAVEADSNVLVEADSSPIAPVSQAPKQQATESPAQQAVEADGSALSEADSTPVSTSGKADGKQAEGSAGVPQMKFLPLV